MRTAREYKELGIPTWYHSHAAYYERLFTNLGWNPDQITRALEFGAKFEGDETQLVQQFKELAAYIDAPDLDLAIDAGLGLRDNININGIESLPALDVEADKFTDADAARLADIRAARRSDPDAYEANKAIQREELGLLELQQGSSGGKGKTISGDITAPREAQPSQPEAKGNHWDRMADGRPVPVNSLEQIREFRRSNPDAYERNKSLQAEELKLIEASLPAPSGEGSAATQPASEGTTNE